MIRWDRYAFRGGDGVHLSSTPRGGDNAFSVAWNPQDANYNNLELLGCPWDTCYLIDNVNEECRAELDPPQVFEMLAEYLMLDFEPTEFGAARRSFRSNAVTTFRAGLRSVRSQRGSAGLQQHV